MSFTILLNFFVLLQNVLAVHFEERKDDDAGKINTDLIMVGSSFIQTCSNVFVKI